jgi:hypothetical protein
MCLALYIASPKPLPVIPWDPDKPAFHVIPLPNEMGAVRKLLNHPNVYYVGSHEGCSCAFNYEHDLKSVLELRDYLRKALTVTDEIEGFSCRPGDEQLNVKHSATISPSGVALPEFYLQDGQRLVFRSRKTMQAQRGRALKRAVSKRKPANLRSQSKKRAL